MLTVVLSACLIGDPSVCREYKIPLSVMLDPQHCVMDAPPYFAKWAEQHPGWQIKSWRCIPSTQDDI